MNKGICTALKWLLTLALVVVSFYFALKDINMSMLWESIRTANYLWVFLSLPIIIASHYVRALRWRTILKPIMNPGSTINLFSAVMVGYFFNSIYPRLGEFVRPYVYAKRENVSKSSVFATIVVERVIDVFTLGFLFAIAFIIARDKIANMLPGVDPQKILMFSVFVLFILFFSFYPPFINFALKFIVKPFSTKIHDRILDIFAKFRLGFSVIKNPRSYIRLIAESLLIWLCYALPMYLMFFCFPFSQTIDVSIGDALFLVIVSGIGVTIAPTPSGIGVMHSLIMYAMMGLYGIQEEMALAYATINHASSLFIQLTVGGIFLIRERITKIPDDLSNNNENNNNIELKTT
ncbi:MAG: flippase-like domain-containing protein [Candidatus Kapabacteria bacterium]|nr:flippase-like domain-containing protein [Ignavibacteriota bacterium]MCW5884554.1 flippase-like domain-containing protein [Candidatus Kapabacteria bacterium]